MARRLRISENASSRFAAAMIPPELWQCVVETLALSPQQARIVELVLRGNRDKQIAATMELSVPTVRTHFARIFDRLGVADRVELILCVFATAHALNGH